MKLASTTLSFIALSAVAVEAAPTKMDFSDDFTSTSIVKREELERALVDLQDLKMMRAKREMLESDLSAREYTIVTSVLEAIKDTKLAPVVLKYFTKNVVLQAAAVQGVLLVVRSHLISAATLLKYLVQSGLITSVINDIIADCSFFAQVLSLVKSELGNIIKRDTPYSHEEGLELLRRDGLIEPTVFDNVNDLEKRDIDEVIINVLESLAQSGLGTQVVEAALTDPQFYTFGALLIGVLYADGLLKLPALLGAVSQSGLVPALFTDLANIKTLRTIAGTAVSAFEGKCSLVATTTTTTGKNATVVSGYTSSTTTKSGSSGGSLLGSLLGGSSLLAGISGLFGKLYGKPSTTSGSYTSKPSVTYATPTTVKPMSATTTITTPLANPCTTAARLFKRERLNMYY